MRGLAFGERLWISRKGTIAVHFLLAIRVAKAAFIKGTNLKCHSDVDMIAFFNPEYGLEMVKKDVIAILDHHPYEVLMDDYEYKLKLKHHFFCCDLLLLEGNHLSDRLPDDHDIFKPDLRGERELSETNLRGHSMDDPVRKAKKAYLAPKSTSYIIRKMNQSPEYRQLARLSKFWGQITVRDKDFKSKSTVMELLAVYVCDSAGKSLDFLSLRDIFQKFLSLFLDKQTIKIFDADQYEGILSDSDLKALKNMSGPLIVDPGNPFNHLHSSKNVPWDSLARYATDTLNRIDVPGATLVCFSLSSC